jgi:hypothetical protein
MHSGDGEGASGNAYRPLPIPREQTSSASEPREGIVLPSKGGRWVPPSQAHREEAHWEQPPAQPPAGTPWGDPQDPYAGQQPHQADYGRPQPQQGGYGSPGHPDAQATQLISPYDPQQGPGAQQFGGGDPYGGGYAQGYGGGPAAGGDADRTQLIAPYGAGQDSEHTQLLTPYGAPSTDLVPQGPGQPLPPEQNYDAPVPPLPQSPPPGGGARHRADPGAAAAAQQGQPPRPAGAPFAIRPGAPGDSPSPAPFEDAAPATQQLPRMDFEQNNWQAQQAGSAQPAAQDDYDYLYRREGGLPQPRAAAPTAQAGRPGGPAGPGGSGGPGYGYGGRAQQPQGGYDNGPRRGGRKKPSPALLALAGVVVLAVIGVTAGAILSGGGGSPSTGASASPSTGAAGGAADAAETQARQLDALLSTSSSSRNAVVNAVASINSCQNLATSASRLRSAARQRDELVEKLSKMSLNALPHGAELLNELTDAWTSSSAADKYYAAWAGQAEQRKGCKGGHAQKTLETSRGDLASGEATLAKQKAVQLWNPIARKYGLTQRQVTQM